jgi:hypothetical protein
MKENEFDPGNCHNHHESGLEKQPLKKPMDQGTVPNIEFVGFLTLQVGRSPFV